MREMRYTEPMIETLTEDQIEALLGKSVYAHMGIHEPHCGKTYVYPITYVYDGKAMYGFSYPGHKIDILAQNPKVCVQIEDASIPHRWSSVMAWGLFSIVKNEEKDAVTGLIHSKLSQENDKGNLLYEPFKNSTKTVLENISKPETILFRIDLVEKTGRYEQYSY